MSQYIAKFDDGGTLTISGKKVNKVDLLATADAHFDDFVKRQKFTKEQY
jgi:hypothetical protein